MTLPDRPRAVVTGAGSGLGRAFCVELAKRGARIIAADVNLASAEETVAMLAKPAEAHAVVCDVAVSEQVAALADEAERRFGGTDLVINNAGVAVGGPIGEVPLENWRWIVGVNLWGVIHGCHHFVPRFRKQGRGAVLNVASAAGLISSPNMGAYNATKAAVVALSETLHVELDGTKITVTVLCPTFFRTNIGVNARGTDDKLKGLVEKLMDRSKIQAPDVARIALETVDAGRLYALPHADGRWMWRMKRLAPEGFLRLTPRAIKRFGDRA